MTVTGALLLSEALCKTENTASTMLPAPAAKEQRAHSKPIPNNNKKQQ